MPEKFNPTPRKYNPSFNYSKGNLLSKGKEFTVIKSKSGIRDYKEKIESANSREEYRKLGFDEYGTHDKNTFWFENKKGDKVILNVKTGEKEVILKD